MQKYRSINADRIKQLCNPKLYAVRWHQMV